MKYKKRLANLQARIQHWEKAGGAFQREHRKPGSRKG